ncbi:hypothetical protein GCM10011609_17310 [Lentzea pudingi]|uniref:Uncharacterized protein n=1 Tax=Lentzea pudingi TaxID=1789439 RepID=A0ABQ2HJ22_9PSEU|nr:hypothetical protein GCM10011609_17310 [Lentzea pudingi]
MVMVIMASVVGLTFLFGFGNVLSLGLRLGVPVWVAPLVAPAVDLSILGLLLSIRHLALSGASLVNGWRRSASGSSADRPFRWWLHHAYRQAASRPDRSPRRLRRCTLHGGTRWRCDRRSIRAGMRGAEQDEDHQNRCWPHP